MTGRPHVHAVLGGPTLDVQPDNDRRWPSSVSLLAPSLVPALGRYALICPQPRTMLSSDPPKIAPCGGLAASTVGAVPLGLP